MCNIAAEAFEAFGEPTDVEVDCQLFSEMTKNLPTVPRVASQSSFTFELLSSSVTTPTLQWHLALKAPHYTFFACALLHKEILSPIGEGGSTIGQSVSHEIIEEPPNPPLNTQIG